VSSLRAALERPVLFFGGKGGVGKTTLAAARALESAAEGARTLLVSTDPAHSTSDAFGVSVGPEPEEVQPDLWVMELDPAGEAEEYIAQVGDRIRDAVPPRLAGEVERQLGVARASPGAEEAALFDRFTRIILRDEYDRIVFDTAPSGHTLRLFSLPDLMASWMGSLIAQREKVNRLGRMWRGAAGDAAGSERATPDVVLDALRERRARFEAAGAVLRDPQRTAFVFVTVPERLPILETERIVRALHGHGVPVGGVVVNQVLPEVVGDDFLLRRKRREAQHLADVAERFRDWDVAYLPLLDHDPVGAAELAGLLEALYTRRAEDRR
jgi:arsenite-transporting ATPase